MGFVYDEDHQAILLNKYVLLAIDPDTLPARLNMELFKALQEGVGAFVFAQPASYDGRKNAFSMYELPLGPTNSREVGVSMCFNHICPHLHSTFYSSSFMYLSLAKVRPLLRLVLPRYTKSS